jgi:hypothetical protein
MALLGLLFRSTIDMAMTAYRVLAVQHYGYPASKGRGTHRELGTLCQAKVSLL